MKRNVLDLMLLLVLLLAGSLSAAGDDAGKAAFIEQGCNKCHAVSTEGIEAKIKSAKMQGPDMATLESDHDAAWMTKYILKEAQLDGKDHKGKWEGTQKDLDQIVAWLAALKE